MANKSPAFQFYAKDWLSSPKIALMAPEHEGAYIRLLAYCWESGDCSLPNDDSVLARLSRLGEGWFKGGSEVVRSCFKEHPTKPGFLTHERLEKEAEKQRRWSEKSAVGGRQSAEKRKSLKGGSGVVEPKGNIAFAIASADRERKASRFTLDAAPPEWVEFCKHERPDLDPVRVFDLFADHWRAKPGKDGTKLDWFATWKNWVRREKRSFAPVSRPPEVRSNKIVL